ncbi:MAG: HAD family phosphatase [bacterium]|nr:HAD family phosphatase [bacterium]
MKKISNQIFAVIFDMDGVIVDSNPTHTIALRKFCDMQGHHLTDDELKTRVYGRPNKDWIPDIFGNRLTPEHYRNLADEKEALFRELFAPIIKPLEGLIDFLQKLEDDNIPKAIASSAPPENVKFTLEKTGIEKYFDIMFNESDIEKGKPDPEIYLKAAAALRFPAKRCIVFEDSLAGVLAAKRAGCKVIGVTTTHSKDEFIGTDWVIKNFEEIGLPTLASLFL